MKIVKTPNYARSNMRRAMVYRILKSLHLVK